VNARRWQQVDKLFHAALALDLADRDAFLDHACKGDEAIRREVESLINSHDKAGSFISSPAVEANPSLIAGDPADSMLQKQIGPYRILSQIGAGGMGEVFLAQDTRLGRKVALKLLPDYFTRDEQRVRRFQQEARAASALNHPNLITIHDIGEADGRHYIATEFVEGETLRQRMASRKFSLNEALDVAVQIASALAVAHQSGIVHRDIKPENIMLRMDGIAKVLDFGLAKLTERQAAMSSTDAPTIAKVDTDPGTVMGTAHYMSPEQARGQAVDERTDIFSFGVVTYEMLAGRPPFEGETPSDVIAAILKTEPAPLTHYLPEAPAELQWIVSKALRKDREERYQTSKEMLGDLRELREKIQIQAKLEPGASAAAKNQAVETSDAAVRRTSSAEYIVSEIKRHKRGAAIALVVIVIAIVGGLFTLSKLIGQRPAAPSQPIKIVKLTSTGKAARAAISPDGKYVAHVMEDAGQQSIWVRHIATGSNVQIVPPAEIGDQFRGTRLTFSPDGSYVYYYRGAKNDGSGAIYQVPVLGGTSKRLLVGVGFAFTGSSDGKRLAFVRPSLDGSERTLVVANSDGTDEQIVTSFKFPQLALPLVWFPDGRAVICVTTSSGAPLDNRLIEVRVADGKVLPIPTPDWPSINSGAWLSDGKGLILSATDRESNLSQIWHLSYPGGESRKITNDLNSYSGVSLAADSSALVTVQSEQVFNIWIAPPGDSSRARPITSGKHLVSSSSWTPDGKILYTTAATASGNQTIWIMAPDGSGQKQLTDDAFTSFAPAVSPDGRHIVFISHRSGFSQLWRMDNDGGNQKRLTDDAALAPQVSPDGQWVIYSPNGPDRSVIWKVPIDGGEPAPLIKDKGIRPNAAVSPDGKLIACNYQEQLGAPLKIAVFSFEGGPPAKILDIPGGLGRRIRWTVDGRALTYSDEQRGVANIWSQPLAGGSPKLLTNFTDGQIISFAWSRDGKELSVTRGSTISDVVLISNFR